MPAPHSQGPACWVLKVIVISFTSTDVGLLWPLLPHSSLPSGVLVECCLLQEASAPATQEHTREPSWELGGHVPPLTKK